MGALLGLATVGLYALLAPGEPPPADERDAPAAIVAASPAKGRALEHPRAGEAALLPKEATVRASATTATTVTEPAARAADPAPSGGPATTPSSSASGQDRAAGSALGDIGVGPPPVAGETEVQLLQRAQDALGGAPAHALELLTQHATRFPSAALGQEREVMSIDALVRLGRIGEARRARRGLRVPLPDLGAPAPPRRAGAQQKNRQRGS